MKKIIFLGFLLLLLFCSSAIAEDNMTLSFEWNQQGEVDGWKLYESLVSGDNYTLVTEIPKESGDNGTYTTDQVIYAPTGQVTTKYIVLTSYLSNGKESSYSNEVSYTFDFRETPQPPFSLKIVIVGQ